MTARRRQVTTRIGQLIDRGIKRKGIRSLRKLEEVCGLSLGYLTHVKYGEIKHPSDEVLRCLAHTLGQRIEEYRLALMVDHNQLPAPVYYFSARLDQPVDEATADVVMRLLEDLVQQKQTGE